MNPRTSWQPPDQPPIVQDDLFGWKVIFLWAGFVLRAPLRHRWLSGAAFVAVFALACAALAVVPFRYQVQATLLAGYQQASALSSPTERGPDTPTRAARDMLLRRENLRAILEKTNFVEQYLEKRPWAIRLKDDVFEYLRGKPREHADLVEGLLDTLATRLWVEVRHEGAVWITFQWWDAELARQIVEAAQESFVEARRASEVRAIGEAVEILEAQRTLLEEDIEAAIAAFEKKQGQLGIPTPARARVVRRAAPADLEVRRLQEELAAMRTSVAEMEGIRLQRVAQLQAELAQQRTIFAPDHPTIVGTRRALASLSEPSARVVEIQGEMAEIERELARRGKQNPPRLSESAPYLEARLGLDEDDPRLDFERGQLENLLRQHADLRNRIQNVVVEKETAEVAFRHRYRVVSPARIPRGPIKPYPVIFLGGGLLGGIAFAFFVAAAADVRSGRVIERWQLEEHLDLPVLAEIRR